MFGIARTIHPGIRDIMKILQVLEAGAVGTLRCSVPPYTTAHWNTSPQPAGGWIQPPIGILICLALEPGRYRRTKDSEPQTDACINSLNYSMVVRRLYPMECG